MAGRTNVEINSSSIFESGCKWVEKVTDAITSIKVKPYTVVRVKASAASGVSLDGTLAATLATNEILLINAGKALEGNDLITITFSGKVYCQIGEE